MSPLDASPSETNFLKLGLGALSGAAGLGRLRVRCSWHRERFCRWQCGRRTDRRCGICLQCCNERDKRDRRIDAGLEAYVPPEKRPAHPLQKRSRQEAEDGRAENGARFAQSNESADFSQENAQSGRYLMALGPPKPCPAILDPPFAPLRSNLGL